MKRVTALALVLVLGGCAGMYGVKFYKAPTPGFSTGSFDIEVQKVQTTLNNKDYYVGLKIKNLKSEAQVFDSGDLELLDSGSGISYFSISKDNDSVTVPAQMNTVITKRTLPAGSTVTGMIWFQTQVGEAKAEKLVLKYAGTTVDLVED